MMIFGICGYLSTIVIFVIVVAFIANELFIQYNERKSNSNFLDEPLYKESRTWTTSFVIFFQILLLCVIMGMITTILLLIVGIDEMVCSSIAFYVTTVLKFIGFAFSFHTLKQIRKKLKILGKVSSSRKRLCGCIFFALSQAISGFYHCCYYGVGSGDGFSIVLILYFVFSALFLLLSSIYYIKIDNNDLFEWKTFSFSTENESSSIKYGSSVDLENSVDVSSLWRARNKDERTKSSDVGIFSKFSFSSATSSELSINVEKADLENYKVRAFIGSNQKQTVSSPSLGGLLNFWNTKKYLGSEANPSSSLFVIEWGKVNLNGKSIIHYKIGLGETQSSIMTDNKRTVKIISKRYDELVFLREKLLIEFPAANLESIPIVVDDDNEVSRVKYDKHRDEMNAYFEKLITNPVCGRTVSMNLKANRDDDLNLPDSTFSPISPSRKVIGSGLSELLDHVDPLLPYLPFDNRLINMNVVGWLKLDNKIYYDIDIKSSSNSWTVRKRFGQFCSLHSALKLTWELPRGIECPVKNIIKEKSNDRDNEIKYNENTIALDAFIKKLASLNPLPSVLLAFLESDVTSRSNGYDIIKDLSGRYQTQKTTLDQLSKRKDRAHRIEKHFKSSKPKALNTISALLPATHSKDDEDDNYSDNESSELDARESSIFATRNSTFFSTTTAKSSKMSPSKLLALPGVLLGELLSLLQYLKVDKIQSKSFVEQKSDYLPAGNISVIDSNATNGEQGCWIMQWRLNRIILSTTAFQEICMRIESLKELNLNNLKDVSLNDADVISFLINLYNLMIVHSSIVTAWGVGFTEMIKKKYDVKYKFASGTISLIQIEYYLLYSKCSGISFNYPTFVPSTEYTIPSKLELNKLFGSLQITKSNPIWYFLLGQSYKSAVMIPGVIYPDNLDSSISAALCEYLKSNVLINQKSVILPKVLRLLGSGLILDNDDVASINDDNEDHEINAIIEALEDKRNTDKPSALSLSDWDRAEIIGGGTGIDDEEIMKKMNDIPLGVIITDSENNFLISESQLVKLKNILLVGVESRDRASIFAAYNNCFVGSEAIRAMIASGQASSKAEGIALCNFLIEYGYICHVSKEHWMMDGLDVYYNYLPFNEKALLACITRLLIKYYQHDSTNTSTTTKYLQLMKGLRSKTNIYYGIENFTFSYPIV